MLNPKAKIRLSILVGAILFSAISIFLIFKTLEDNIIYFYSPSEIKQINDIDTNKSIRVGGMVKDGSIQTKKDEIKFIVTDFKNEIIVTFSGTVPALFAEGKGVVAEGKLQDKEFFLAKRILAKHDENYMPPEINKNLEQNAK
tara:strand:- start:1537 stop:1965 length:429 start_codon:yes stop_codon:yes gene_type:complete